MHYEKVGQKIKDYRKKKRLTQQVLADRVGVTWEMISRYERGASSPFSRIDKISEALEIEPHQLLQNDNNANQTSNFMVPFFKTIPSNNVFSPQNTTHMYTAPAWMKELEVTPYAIEAKILKINTLDVRNNGIIFATDKIVTSNGVFLENDGGIIRVTNDVTNAFAQVVAQEVRLV